MKYLNFLHSTKKLEQQALIDIALLLAFLPHLFTLKMPMLVYLFLALVFIIKKKNSKLVIGSFAFLGLVAIGLSFFAEYNFSNFSRLLVFISLLISILSYAVLLQRLTQEINFYLLISPALLMILSFFFFNSIGMLFYSLFTLFSFTFLILYQRMQSTLNNVLRINGLLYLFCLPLVLLLFLTFPRISYKNARFGFTAEEIKRTGHDGTMHLDSNALLVPSPKLVMEVTFDKDIPSNQNLYFRGSILYKDMGTKWIQDTRTYINKTMPLLVDNIIDYQVKLYPHNKRWIYMLDIPLLEPLKANIDKDFITRSNQAIIKTLSYRARSSLSYTLPKENPQILKMALIQDKQRDPKTYKALHKQLDLRKDDLSKANSLLSFFSSLDLSYSLKPKPIDLKHPLDSFLYDSKVGYCVHFASSFATAARMIGIPSRIITGYKADKNNAINNYLLVKEADAHAWVELYIKGKGWTRFEPTMTARRVLAPENPQLSNSYTNASMHLSTMQKLFKQANIYYMYTRYVINNWVLQYSRVKQMSLLKELLSNTLFLIKFIASVLAVIFTSIMLFVFLQRKVCSDEALCEMQVLLKLLNTEGLQRLQGETMFAFLSRIKENKNYKKELEEISEIYHLYKYSQKKDEELLARLRAKVLGLRKVLKRD